ncbi:MAG: HU family DNA-binding protein [Phocaeicola sp.]|nr:HU family DNA-binding protein [Phocaeicola sp.]
MNEKVSLQDLAAMVADDCKISRKKADQFIRDMFDVILEALKKEKYVKIKGLGTFKLTEVSPRVSVNVSTGERFEIQGHRKITFTPENKIKELINKPFAHFEPVVLNEGVQFDDVLDDIEKDVEMDTEEVAEKSVIPETTTVEEETKEQEPEPVQEEAVVDKPILEETKEELVEEAPEVEKNPEVEKIAEIPTEEPMPETSIEEKPVVVSPDPIPLMQTKKKTPWGWIIGVLCALLIIVLVVWLLVPKTTKEVPYEIYQPEKAVVSSTPADTLQQRKKDEVAPTQPEPVKEEVVTPKPVETPKPVAPAVQPAVPALSTNVVKETIADTLEYRITGLKTTYTLKEGETLARVAANFYQNRRLWPYIAKYNKDILPNVNRVVPGMVIRVPELAPVE